MERVVALYVRTSTDRQTTGLEAQQLALETYAQANRLGLYRVFSDEGISGAKSSRPSLNALMESVRRGEVSTVICWSFSRFARSTKHLLEALETFDRHGVRFISLTEQLDTSTPVGRAVFTIIAAISQLEKELISERVRNGLVNARAKGKKIGAPKKHADKGGLIRHLADQGLSHRKIAELAHVSQSTVSRMLRSIESERAA